MIRVMRLRLLLARTGTESPTVISIMAPSA